jgi:hypothetical protein
MGGVEVVILDLFAARLGTHKAEGSERSNAWGLGFAARYGDVGGIRFGYAKTDMDILGEVERFMLAVNLFNCSDGLDTKALIEYLRTL